jgi:hypothetical protein
LLRVGCCQLLYTENWKDKVGDIKHN